MRQYVQWDKFAHKVRAGNFNYSTSEKLDRAFILVTGIGTAAYCYFQNFSNTSTSLCTVAALVVTHSLTISNLVYKRHLLYARIDAAEAGINQLIQDETDAEYLTKIQICISDIHAVKHTSLSHTLGEKARKMEDLLNDVQGHYQAEGIAI